jgi:DNA-binding MarR family transcriptional regulator
MIPLDQRATELRHRLEEFLERFKRTDAVTSGGPHAELSCQDLRVVIHLGDAGPRMMRELAEFLPVAVNTMTTLVDNLEHKQIVQRQRCAEDRRVVRVSLTETGRGFYQTAVDEKMRFFRNMLSMLTEEEQDIFMVLFRKIARGGQESRVSVA